MSATTRSWLIAGTIFLTVLFLLAGSAFIAWIFFQPVRGIGPMRGQPLGNRSAFRDYESNGERIYFTGTSANGPAISAQMESMHRMPAGRIACVDCHGVDGRGGDVRMMMGAYEAPDIRYSTLTSGEHAEADEEHPPFTDEDIKRAITEGIEPSGEQLEWIMPRWKMSDEQLDDLIAFLKILE